MQNHIIPFYFPSHLSSTLLHFRLMLLTAHRDLTVQKKKKQKEKKENKKGEGIRRSNLSADGKTFGSRQRPSIFHREIMTVTVEKYGAFGRNGGEDGIQPHASGQVVNK